MKIDNWFIYATIVLVSLYAVRIYLNFCQSKPTFEQHIASDPWLQIKAVLDTTPDTSVIWVRVRRLSDERECKIFDNCTPPLKLCEDFK